MRRTPSNTRGLVRQRGSVAIWVGIAIVALMTATFLAIDTGRLYYTQRQLQRLAGLAATAGVQVASGCTGPNANGTPGSLSAVTNLVQTFLTTNGGSIAYLTGINGAPAVELGTMTPVNGIKVFKSLPAGDPGISAVRVNLTQPQPTPFVGFISGGATLQASATAEQPLSGSFSVGSTTLALSGGMLNQVLGGLVCAAGDVACQNQVIALNAVSYSSGLANASVSLGQLSTAAGVSVKDLSDPLTLSTKTVILSDLINGLATQTSGTVSTGVTQVLQNLAAASAGNRQAIPLGQVLGAVDDVAGAVPVANLLDLIMALGAASHADPTGAVTPIQLQPTVNVAGVGSVTSYLRVLQPAQLSGTGRPGVATAKTSQVKLEIRIKGDALVSAISAAVNSALSVNLGLISITPVVTPTVNIGVDLTVASASAFLDAIECPAGSKNNGMPIAQLSAMTGLADASIGTFSGTPTATFSPPLNPAGSLDVLKLTISAVLLGTTTETVRLSFTSADVAQSSRRSLNDVTLFQRQSPIPAGTPLIYDALGGPSVLPVLAVTGNPQTVGAPINVSLTAGVSVIPGGTGALGAVSSLVSGLLNTVVGLLQPVTTLVNGLATSLINPLLSALGIQTGAGTVTMDAVQVGRPTKVATCLPGATGAQACAVAP